MVAFTVDMSVYLSLGSFIASNYPRFGELKVEHILGFNSNIWWCRSAAAGPLNNARFFAPTPALVMVGWRHTLAA